MKKYFLILLIASILCSCSDDEKIIFDVNLSDLQITFESYEGGAYMNYSLPASTDVYGIQVKYKDYKGEDITVKGTHTNNQLDLFGFNKAQDDVPVEIALIDHDGNLSKTINRSFSTLNSAALSVFDELEVSSHWNGFRVSYPAFSGRSEGVVNIFFVGTNPKTNEIDSLLVSSLPFFENGHTFKYTGIEDESIKDVTIVVKTEDSRGNFIKKKIFEKVDVAHAKQFNSADIDFTGSSIEDDSKKLGSKYLFDGDVRGEQCLEKGNSSKLYSYKSEEGAEFDERNVLTLDLKGENEIAWIRIYSHLSARMPNAAAGGMTYTTMKLGYKWYYPNHVTLYGTNDKDAPEEEWVELSSFYQSALLDIESSWIAPAFDFENYYTVDEIDMFKKADPNYIQLNCDISGNSYRYLKVKINETFYSKTSTTLGKKGYFGMEELEVFVKSE